MSVIFFLNFVIILGIVVSAWLAVSFDDLLSSIIALGATGTLVALEFIMLSAPDVAIAEAAVGAVLSTVIFIVGLRRVMPKEGEDQ
ncbi:MAG: DUF4040 domain-containing protein [Firmicutes bacterium]|jgi:uncharacterized MnhB-related membrane protein|nr:DUF4040 domain-containing protein [Bacillota bacterium]MBQ6123474.1 DUF4040 domain-containing protein [Clostridia bacterium]MBQ3286724.1 DUF4040 domain-containing protein [Bacillota bacterium]MBQ6607153.1 DUF4040 domain-containing protein [Bacillota bacterium]MBR0179016.1 DUF4040 domain-containing protein [Bacillota bacterium]